MSQNFKPPIKQIDLWISAALALSSLALYIRTMPPTVLEGDSGEYQFMAAILGVPHSTGYPLYILLAKLFTLLPIGAVALRVTFFSALCAALTTPIIYAIGVRLVQRRVPAMLAALMLALAPTLWSAAIDAEVYALHLLLGALAIFFALRWHHDNHARDFYALALVYGLGLTNHRVIVFLTPALLLVIWLNRARLTRAMFARGALLAIVPLLLYAYIPIRADQLIATQDAENWKLYPREDAIVKGTVSAYYRHTPDGVFNLITGFDNRNKLGFKSPLDEANRIELATNLLAQQFGILGIALALIGAVASLRRDRGSFAILATTIAGVGFIAIYLRGESTVYYFSLAYLALALWLAFGADVLMRGARRVPIKHFDRATSLALCALPVFALVTNFPRFDKSNYFTARDFAQTVFADHLAPNAVVIAPWEISQPLRYFQFVENQRPDLLVVNISPVWDKQFGLLHTNAHALGRPFYLVEFNPELKTAPGPRSVQAVPLPLRDEPRPRYALNDARIIGDVQVVGYDLEPDPPIPGQRARVLVYYKTLARMYPMYAAQLSIRDLLERPALDLHAFPASFYYPTYRWRAGEFYRDAYAFVLPADAPNGIYHLDLFWYEYDLGTGVTDFDRENKLALGEMRVGDFNTARIAQPAHARVGDAITFLGWRGDTTIARGQSLDLDLFWRGDRVMREAYTVFVHLTDASGQVLADADSPPAQGLYPTTRWLSGEIVRDRHSLKIPGDLAPGEYQIAIGMYLPATGARLPVDPGGDYIALTKIVVK
ncbi:MAG: DUF2723 domain-containing protein [Chloroflexi bacterium]|nr:DUF2723 domain-containing protein [Chloroflexota bacterium]